MGISRACASKWVNRYRRFSEIGLLDRSSTPRHQPTATPAPPGTDPAVVAVRARAPGDPDVAPPGVDGRDSRRPWRSYAVQHLRVAGELDC